jgi:hypothetical protein
VLDRGRLEEATLSRKVAGQNLAFCWKEFNYLMRSAVKANARFAGEGSWELGTGENVTNR